MLVLHGICKHCSFTSACYILTCHWGKYPSDMSLPHARNIVGSCCRVCEWLARSKGIVSETGSVQYLVFHRPERCLSLAMAVDGKSERYAREPEVVPRRTRHKHDRKCILKTHQLRLDRVRHKTISAPAILRQDSRDSNYKKKRQSRLQKWIRLELHEIFPSINESFERF